MTTDTATLQHEIEEALAEIEVYDVHTHLVGGSLGAQGLHDIALYHMVVTELYSAGCPSGARLTQYPEWPTKAEAHQRLAEAVEFLPKTRNTGISWCLRTILSDLYDWHEPIDSQNWQRLDAIVRERAQDRSHAYGILDRLKIRRTGTEIARRGNGSDDARLQYALEWGMFTRCQWGEYDTALYELERAYGKPPQSPAPIVGAQQRARTDHTVRTVNDVRAAMHHYIERIPYSKVLATATGISTNIDYAPVTDSQMQAAMDNRSSASDKERSIYASYINELLLSGLEEHGDKIVFQFSIGAEPLPFETACLISQKTIGQIGDMVGRHPRLRFQCFNASRHANQSLCTLARELPNLSLCGYWWHGFYPAAIRQVIDERLDFLPLNKQIGFFSDAYCAEWAYGKLILVRKQLAAVLAQKIQSGQYSHEDALSIAKTILFETPHDLLGFTPCESSGRSDSM